MSVDTQTDLGHVSGDAEIDHWNKHPATFKRVIDLIGASIGVIIASPLLLLVGLLILVTDGRPVLFQRDLVGRGGKLFPCLKFRTMVRDADERLSDLLCNDSAAAQEWARFRKLRNDPRILPFGRMLRASSLDELPQLFNILRGDMSLVGPRPVDSDELNKYYGGRYARSYMSVRPGLTGLWQVSGRSDVGYDKRVALDVAYVASHSVLGDFWIMLRTVKVLLHRDGAY